jgi:hypothetical protein
MLNTTTDAMKAQEEELLISKLGQLLTLRLINHFSEALLLEERDAGGLLNGQSGHLTLFNLAMTF